jgi:hypothetical protein
MKKVLFLVIFNLISYDIFCQDLTARLTSSLNEASKDIPSDKLFLHLDRNLYHAGDTIRFQAYVRDSRTGIFMTESSSMYAMLINSSHKMIDSARFRIILAAVPGWLKIPPDAPTGDYSILAFTSSDMNFNPSYAFSTPIRIEPLRTSLIDKEKKPGSKDTLNFDLFPPETTTDLKFLPEGGTFIYGISQKLAFNAVTSTGRTLQVTGTVFRENGVKITDFKPGAYGPGILEFTPASGHTYYAELDGSQFKGKKWLLPVPQESGVALKIGYQNDETIDIVLMGRQAGNTPYLLTVTMNNILVFSETVKIDSLFRKKIRADKLPAGTAYVTLFDNELRPVAERLVFLNNQKRMNVALKVARKEYFRGEETELKLTTTDLAGKGISSLVSVSVADSATGYSSSIPSQEIESAFLFDKVFYDNLPLRIRMAGLNIADSKAMDILLLTYGFRRFVPKEITAGPDIEMVNYDCITITNPGSLKNGRQDFKIVTDVGIDLVNLPLNENREAQLYFDSLDYSVRQILVLPDLKLNRNFNPVNILFPENRNYYEKAKQAAAFTPYFSKDMPLVIKPEQELNLEGYVPIEGITIKAPVQPLKTRAYVDVHSRQYQSAGARTWYKRDFGSASNLEDILYKYNPYRLVTNNMTSSSNRKQLFFRATSSYLNGGHTVRINNKDVFIPDDRESAALFVVDNTPVGNDYEMIAQMPVSQIASVTFLKGPQGFSMYGNKAVGGVVFITTYTGSGYTEKQIDKMNEVVRSDALMKEVRLFRTETEFYIPTKEQVLTDPDYRFRSTILWKDNVQVDSTGTITLKYPNNLVGGTAIITVNGVSMNNMPGSGKLSYAVK